MVSDMGTPTRHSISGMDARQGVVIVRGSADGFAQAVIAGSHHVRVDEPAAVGGTDSGPAPYDLLLAALGSCTSMTVAIYARRKKWPLEHTEMPKSTLSLPRYEGDSGVITANPSPNLSDRFSNARVS